MHCKAFENLMSWVMFRGTHGIDFFFKHTGSTNKANVRTIGRRRGSGGKDVPPRKHDRKKMNVPSCTHIFSHFAIAREHVGFEDGVVSSSQRQLFGMMSSVHLLVLQVQAWDICL